MNSKNSFPPELHVSKWLNSEHDISLESLRGRVIVLHAFQMLCPSCVSHGLPQASAIYRTFARSELEVIGLHTVFEHHNAMNENALRAFVHEYRIPFPIGIDKAALDSHVPITMQAYSLKGTPSLLLFDRLGQLRLHHFGPIDDLQLGGIIGQLIAEKPLARLSTNNKEISNSNCDETGCQI